MKKWIWALLLSLVLVMSLGGCGNSPIETVSSEPSSLASEVSAPVEQSVSLEPDLQQALDLGLVPLALLEQPDELMNELDAARMIQAVDDLQYGKGHSKYLADMTGGNLSLASKPATRFWLAQLIYHSYCEEVFDEPYADWVQWSDYCTAQGYSEELILDAATVGKRLTDGKFGEGDLWALCTDAGSIVGDEDACARGITPSGDYRHTWGNPSAVMLCTNLFDRTTGLKVLPLGEDGTFRPQETLTVREAVAAALRYHRYFPEKPEKKAYGEVGNYDQSIITPELLAKPSKLPDCSSQKLPAEWKGICVYTMCHVTRGAVAGDVDAVTKKEDIALIKEAGFNMIAFHTHFSKLQGPFFEQGYVNESNLRELDQILAWCIEQDIHMDLRCYMPTGADDMMPFKDTETALATRMQTEPALRDDFTAFWGMLARRYKDIPNKYLSFNVLTEPEIPSAAVYLKTLGPAIEAIRAASPDRATAVDIHDGRFTVRDAEEVAKLGVALNYHSYMPRDFCVRDKFSTLGDAEALAKIEGYSDDELRAMQWPHTDAKGKTWDAQAVLNAPMLPSPDPNVEGSGMSLLEMKAVADQYGVGFIVGEFGMFGIEPGMLPTVAYPKEAVFAYYKDMTDTFTANGIPWTCAATWYNDYGLVSAWPSIEWAQYTKLPNSPHWVNDDMMAFWQGLLK